MYYAELVYLDDQGKVITYETIPLYAENEADAEVKAYTAYLNSTADDYQLKQE